MTVKMKDLKKDLRAMPLKDLVTQLDESRKRLFRLKFDAVTAHVKDYSLFKKMRKNIAFILTLIQQRGSEGNVNEK